MPNSASSTTLLLLGVLVSAVAGADTHTVTATSDIVDSGDGVITLREAVNQANQDLSGNPVIRFDLPGAEPLITLQAPLALEKPLTLEGPSDTRVTLSLSESSDGPLFTLAGSASGSTLSRLVFKGHPGANFLAASGDAVIEDSTVRDFRQVITLQGSALQQAFRNSVLKANGRILGATGYNLFGSTRLTGAALTIEGSLLEGNGSIARVDNDANDSTPLTVTLDGSRITGQTDGDTLHLRGAVALHIEASTIDGNNPDTLITALLDNHVNSPQVSLFNDTVSGNQWTAAQPLVRVEGAGLSVRHSTFTQNSTANDMPLISADDALVDHSILTDNPGVSRDLAGAGETGYSLVDNTAATYSAIAMVSGDAILDVLTFSDTLTGTHSPLPTSPVIGAGNTDLAAGTGNTPANDQRGSERIINGVIDIGSVEFNRAPLINVPALQAAFHGEELELEITDIDLDLGFTSNLWSGSGSGAGLSGTIAIYGFGDVMSVDSYLDGLGEQDDTIVISGSLRLETSTPVASALTVAETFDMDLYTHDPDQGDQVTDIALVSAATGVSVDDSTHVLSGSRNALVEKPVVMALTDEHGLTGIRSISFSEPAAQDTPASADDNGGAGLGLSLLTLLGWLRRRL